MIRLVSRIAGKLCNHLCSGQDCDSIKALQVDLEYYEDESVKYSIVQNAIREELGQLRTDNQLLEEQRSLLTCAVAHCLYPDCACQTIDILDKRWPDWRNWHDSVNPPSSHSGCNRALQEYQELVDEVDELHTECTRGKASLRELEMAEAAAMALVISHEGHIGTLESEITRLQLELSKCAGDAADAIGEVSMAQHNECLVMQAEVKRLKRKISNQEANYAKAAKMHETACRKVDELLDENESLLKASMTQIELRVREGHQIKHLQHAVDVAQRFWRALKANGYTDTPPANGMCDLEIELEHALKALDKNLNSEKFSSEPEAPECDLDIDESSRNDSIDTVCTERNEAEAEVTREQYTKVVETANKLCESHKRFSGGTWDALRSAISDLLEKKDCE